jgi:hypothetical protein
MQKHMNILKSLSRHQSTNNGQSEVSKAVIMKRATFWNVTPSSHALAQQIILRDSLLPSYTPCSFYPFPSHWLTSG